MRLQSMKTKPASGDPQASGNRNDEPATRPVRQLLRLLPLLTAANHAESPAPGMPGTLADLAESAEASIRTIHLGVGALGHLVARCAMDLQDGSVPADSIENLGFLMA